MGKGDVGLEQSLTVQVIDYNAMGFGVIMERAAQMAGQNIPDDSKLMFLADMRSVMKDKIANIKSLSSVDVRNVVVCGFSFGALVASLFVDELKSSGLQVQALLTGQAPPFAFFTGSPIEASSMLPAFMYSEVGSNDPLFPDAENKTKQIFHKIRDGVHKSLSDRFSYYIHNYEHGLSNEFFKILKNVLMTVVHSKGFAESSNLNNYSFYVDLRNQEWNTAFSLVNGLGEFEDGHGYWAPGTSNDTAAQSRKVILTTKEPLSGRFTLEIEATRHVNENTTVQVGSKQYAVNLPEGGTYSSAPIVSVAVDLGEEQTNKIIIDVPNNHDHEGRKLGILFHAIRILKV